MPLSAIDKIYEYASKEERHSIPVKPVDTVTLIEVTLHEGDDPT